LNSGLKKKKKKRKEKGKNRRNKKKRKENEKESSCQHCRNSSLNRIPERKFAYSQATLYFQQPSGPPRF
jgi:hypothetical protein